MPQFPRRMMLRSGFRGLGAAGEGSGDTWRGCGVEVPAWGSHTWGTLGGHPPPHGGVRVPSPRGGRGVGTSSDTAAVLQGTGTRGSDPRCHPNPPVPPEPPSATCIPPGVTCTPQCTRWGPLLGSLPGPPRVPLLQDPLSLGLGFGGAAPWQRGSAPSPTMPMVGKRGPPPYPLLPSTDPPHLELPPPPERGQALGEGMAGWHGAPGGLVGAPVSLLHPLLYIDPSPRLPPLPFSLFKRYFHSWRVLYRQLKLIIYTGVCWIGGGLTPEVGGARGPPQLWVPCPTGLHGMGGQGWQGRVLREPQTPPLYPVMSQGLLSPCHIPSKQDPWGQRTSQGLSQPRGDPSSPPKIKRGHEQGATYFQNNRCIFIDALNAMTCFFTLKENKHLLETACYTQSSV